MSMIGGLNLGQPGFLAPLVRQSAATKPETGGDGRGEPVAAPESIIRPFSAVTTDKAFSSNVDPRQPGEARPPRLSEVAEGMIAMSDFRKEVVLEDLCTLRQAGHLLAPKAGAADLLPCKAEAAMGMMQERQLVYFQSTSREEPVAIKDFDHLRELALQAEQRVVG